MTNLSTEPGDAPRAQPPRRPRHRILPRLVVMVLVAGAVGGGTWYYLLHPEEDNRRLVLQGNIDVRQVNLAFKVEGRIETLNVDEGDVVKAGQVLATLDKRYFDDELRLARARATTRRRSSSGSSMARVRRRSPRRKPRSPSGRPPGTMRDWPSNDGRR